VLQRALDLATRLVRADPALAAVRVLAGEASRCIDHTNGAVRAAAVQLLAAVAVEKCGYSALRENGTLARLVQLEGDVELAVRTEVAHVTAELFAMHGDVFGAEVDRARYQPTDEETWGTAAEVRAETKAELGAMVEGAIGRHHVRSKGRVEAMKNNAAAKRRPPTPFRHEPMSATYYRHDEARDVAARAQGAAAQRWRTQASPNSGGGGGLAGLPTPARGYNPGPGPGLAAAATARGGGIPTPLLIGFGAGSSGVPALSLRSSGRDGTGRSRASTRSVPSLPSTVRELADQ
jgi:hypothetical protein